jgi:hypothetical protein
VLALSKAMHQPRCARQYEQIMHSPDNRRFIRRRRRRKKDYKEIRDGIGEQKLFQVLQNAEQYTWR